MGLFELFVIAIGLSMDAFAVAVSSGMCCVRPDRGCVLKLAGFFGTPIKDQRRSAGVIASSMLLNTRI